MTDGSKRTAPLRGPLATKTESCDERAVPLNVFLAQVPQLPTPLADEPEQPAPRVEVVLVQAKVLGEVLDAFGEDGDLDPRRACVLVVLPEFRDHVALGSERHPSFLSLYS